MQGIPPLDLQPHHLLSLGENRRLVLQLRTWSLPKSAEVGVS